MKTCKTCKYWISTIHAGECTLLNTDDSMKFYVLVPCANEPGDEKVIIMTDPRFGCSEWVISDEHKREVKEEHRERIYEETLEQRGLIHEYLIAKGRI